MYVIGLSVSLIQIRKIDGESSSYVDALNLPHAQSAGMSVENHESELRCMRLLTNIF